MRKLILTQLLFYSCLLIFFSAQAETMDDLVQRDGLYYKKFSDTPFTGQIEGRNRGQLKSGRFIGSWVHYYENGQLWMKGEWDGLQQGFWISYSENGQLLSKGDYKDGKRVGRWFFYDQFGNLNNTRSGVYKGGVKIND